MPRQASSHPTEFELELLKILWEQAPLPVSEIRERLSAVGRENAHTSIITILNIMVGKGYVDRRKRGKSYQFWPVVTAEQVSQLMVGDVVKRLFDGSAKRLALNLIDTEDLERTELMELRRLINRKMREQQDDD